MTRRLPVVDCHAHFVPADVVDATPQGAGSTQSGLLAAHRLMPRSVTDLELVALMDDAGVDDLVMVTPSVMRYDNRHSVASAARYPERMRVVAHVDAAAAGSEEVLEALAAEPMVVGVRVIALGDDRAALGADGMTGFWARAAALRLPVCVYAPQAAVILGAVARRHPGLTLLLDHACADVLPGGEDRDRFAGFSDVLALADLENVVVKVSGLPDAASEPYPFPAAQARLRELLTRFGAERLVWGSNFPPVQLVGSYREAADWLRTECDGLDQAQRAAILGGNAIRILGLPFGETPA